MIDQFVFSGVGKTSGNSFVAGTTESRDARVDKDNREEETKGQTAAHEKGEQKKSLVFSMEIENVKKWSLNGPVKAVLIMCLRTINQFKYSRPSAHKIIQAGDP